MRSWLTLLLWTCIPLWAVSKSPLWKASLQQSLGLQSFNREAAAVWMIQQGVLFLTSDQVLVYQVNRSAEQAKLAPRGAGGGAGNFFLNIRVLNVQDGHLIKSLDLPTNAGLSRVMATRGGGFVARTGTTLNLYSANFQLVASRELPLEKAAPIEGWQVRVSPSGAEVVLLHEQVFATAEVLADNTVLHDGKAKVDVEVLSSDTLQPQKTFTLAHTLPFWAPADNLLVSSNPAHSYSDGQVGILDFNGSWAPIQADFQMARSSCPYSVNAIDQKRIVVFGCETLTVLSTAGQRVLSVNDSRFVFRSVAGSGSYLAVACDHYRVGQVAPGGSSALSTRADRVEVYDMESHRRLLSVPIHSESGYYAISRQGDLAVVDGTALEMFQAGP
jgi:hypothetical protein